MRQTTMVLTILLMLAACNNFDRPKKISNTQTEQQIDTTKSARHILIEELKKLQQIVASNDKEKIASLFKFPLSDTAFSIYLDDNTYNEQFKANDHKTTKAMFLQYFKNISENFWLDQLNNLFKYINVDSLLVKDILENDASVKTEPCYYSYKIEVIRDRVALRMKMNSNKNYKSKKSEDDIPENSSEICEHNFWWVFKFDGKQLYLENISGAG